MLCKDFKSFLQALERNQHIFLLVNCDVDAICAAKTLTIPYYMICETHRQRLGCGYFQHLLKCEHITYSLIPVTGRQDLQRAFSENAEKMSCCVLINCGAEIYIIDEFEDVTFNQNAKFYICDSHRPIQLDNIFDQKQVFVLMTKDEIQDSMFPEYKEIYESESEESGEEDEDEGSDDEDGEEIELSQDKENASASLDDDGTDGSPSVKRKKQHQSSSNNAESRVLKAAKKQRWTETRAELLWNYYQYSYTSSASSRLMYELTRLKSKSSLQLIWNAIVGLTSQFVLAQINSDCYTQATLGDLKREVKRAMRDIGQDVKDSVTVHPIQELSLSLYKHWSLEESLTHSPLSYSLFRLWEVNGRQRLQAFLADIGLPLTECKQKYCGMKSEYQKELLSSFSAYTRKEGRERWEDMVYASFEAKFGWKHRVNAVDNVAATSSLLEIGERKSCDLFESFNTAMDSLEISNVALINEGLELHKDFLNVVRREIHTALTQMTIKICPLFLVYSIPPGTIDVKYLRNPHSLIYFGHFLLRSHNESKRGKKGGNRPLVIEVPLNEENGEEWHLVAGIPPLATLKAEERPKSFLGRAFVKAASAANCQFDKFASFEPSVIKLKSAHRGRFMDRLMSLLTSS